MAEYGARRDGVRGGRWRNLTINPLSPVARHPCFAPCVHAPAHIRPTWVSEDSFSRNAAPSSESRPVTSSPMRFTVSRNDLLDLFLFGAGRPVLIILPHPRRRVSLKRPCNGFARQHHQWVVVKGFAGVRASESFDRNKYDESRPNRVGNTFGVAFGNAFRSVKR